MEDRTQPKVTRTQIAAVVIGNALEFYDFTVYGFFAVYIGRAFFPNHSAFTSLMLSLLTYGVGFVMRPVGAVLIGRFADRRGRRPAMVLSIALMGIAILGLAFTPTYATIGIAAPILVVFWRLCQGIAMGGESGPTMAFLVEAAPAAKRAAYGAWMYFSHGLATIAGGLVGLLVTTAFGQERLETWGWRVAFLIGALVLPFAVILRRTLPETLHAPEASAPAARGTAPARVWPLVALGLGLVASQTIMSYTLSFTTTYAITTLHMPASTSLAATMAVGLSYLVGSLLGGWLADRYGRRPIMVLPRIGILLAALPIYHLIVNSRNAASLIMGAIVVSTLTFMSVTASTVSFTESLRKEIRSMGSGTIIAAGIAVFGSATQPLLAWLIHSTGNPLAPAWMLMGAAIIGIVAGTAMRESRPRSPVAAPRSDV